jgi:hypothetical protein
MIRTRQRLLNNAAAFWGGTDVFAQRDRQLRNRQERRRFKQTNGGDAGSTVTGPASQQQANDNAQRTVLALARPMIQQFGLMASVAADDATLGQTFTQVLQNVGLNTKLTVECTFSIRAAAAETLNKTAFGAMNFLSNITLTDLSNYQRVNTYGQHLFLLNSLRRQMPYGCAYVNDSPVNMGSTWTINNAPAAVVGAVKQKCRIFYEIPLAYHDYDLRGAIYAQVTSAQWRLAVTVNPNFIVGSGATDTLFNGYKSTTANDVGHVSDVSIAIYQHYLDQIPPGPNGMPVLPLLSLAWNYLILNAPQTGILQGNDFPVQYANFRTFLSTIAIFDNAGAFNTGSDVNYVGIQVANQTFLEKLDPFMATNKARGYFGDDPPPGVYVFDHRRWPIVTNQFGNTQFVLNASQVNAGASLQMYYEMLSVQAQAINAGSLAAS